MNNDGDLLGPCEGDLLGVAVGLLNCKELGGFVLKSKYSFESIEIKKSHFVCLLTLEELFEGLPVELSPRTRYMVEAFKLTASS